MRAAHAPAGRQEEVARLEEALERARRGESATLVLTGEAGIGKSVLLEHAAATATDMRTLSARPVESEVELPFSGLLELLRPILSLADELSPHQADVLERALALGRPTRGGRFAVFASTLALVAVAAEERPLLLAVDDFQWFDRVSADALLFVARRLRSDRVAVLVAAREPVPTELARGFDTIALPGLDARAAAELVPPGTSAEVVAQLVAATGGNPLALIEAATALSEPELAGSQPLPHPVPAIGAAGRLFGDRVERLPGAARLALAVCAVSEFDDLTTLSRAFAALRLGDSPTAAAEEAELVVIDGGRVHFRHPLVRSAAYAAASPTDRRRAHSALAAALDVERRADARAWHRALAAAEPDEEVASELDAAGARARDASWGAAARAYEHAARLTPDPGRRAERLLEAAEASRLAGQLDVASEHLPEVLRLAEDPLTLARAEHALGRIALHEARTSAGIELLETAASHVEDAEPTLAALILSEIVQPIAFAGDFERAFEIAERAWNLPRRAGDYAEIAVAMTYGDALAWAGQFDRAKDAWLHAAESAEAPAFREHAEARAQAGAALYSADEGPRAREVLSAAIALARRQARLDALRLALTYLSLLEARAGDLDAARAAVEEAFELARALGRVEEERHAVGQLSWIEGLLGREHECRRRVAEAGALGIPTNVSQALGLLELSLGNAEAAVLQLTLIAERRHSFVCDATSARPVLASLVEAHVRAGHLAEAERALAALTEQAHRSGRPRALAEAARCRGLLAPDSALDEHFGEALRRHDEAGNGFERARTQLCFGERLRRARRRRDARGPLREALRVFDAAGARAWAERARAELAAAGGTPPSRPRARGEDLTPQERHVAALVREGLTNKEIASRLFLSPKTVETHLAHIFAKRGVRSRTELAVLVSTQPPGT